MIIRRRIKLTQSWSSDQDYITEATNYVALTQSWKKQVLLEFNDCNVSHPDRHPSVLTLDSKVTLCVEGNDIVGGLPDTFKSMRLLQTLTVDVAQRVDSEGRVIPGVVYERGGVMIIKYLNDDLPQFLAEQLVAREEASEAEAKLEGETAAKQSEHEA